MIKLLTLTTLSTSRLSKTINWTLIEESKTFYLAAIRIYENLCKAKALFTGICRMNRINAFNKNLQIHGLRLKPKIQSLRAFGLGSILHILHIPVKSPCEMSAVGF